MKLIILFLLIATFSFAQTRPPDKLIVGHNLTTVTSAVNKASAAITGSGVINQIAYWTGTATIGNLPTATYPSLAQLAYVKGVTSNIQTQLNSKQATLVSGQNIRPVNGQSLVGSTNLVIAADTTGLWLQVYNIVKSQMVGDLIIADAAELNAMILDYRKNNVLRVNE